MRDMNIELKGQDTKMSDNLPWNARMRQVLHGPLRYKA